MDKTTKTYVCLRRQRMPHLNCPPVDKEGEHCDRCTMLTNASYWKNQQKGNLIGLANSVAYLRRVRR